MRVALVVHPVQFAGPAGPFGLPGAGAFADLPQQIGGEAAEQVKAGMQPIASLPQGQPLLFEGVYAVAQGGVVVGGRQRPARRPAAFPYPWRTGQVDMGEHLPPACQGFQGETDAGAGLPDLFGGEACGRVGGQQRGQPTDGGRLARARAALEQDPCRHTAIFTPASGGGPGGLGRTGVFGCGPVPVPPSRVWRRA